MAEINCPHCGLKEQVNNCPPLTFLERLEYHNRGGCVKNDLGLDSNDWIKKWRGEKNNG